MEIPTEWIVGLGGTCITMGGAIWAYIKSQHKGLILRMDNQANRLEQKLDKCEERHLDRDQQTFDLAEKVGRLSGVNEVVDRLERVVKDALHEVKNS